MKKKKYKYPGESLLELAKIGKQSKDPYGPENLSENYKKYLYIERKKFNPDSNSGKS